MGVSYNPRIVTDGLVFCVDAANPRSYPGAGTTWTDLTANKNNGTLTNMTDNFSTDGAGSLIFDGTNEYINIGTAFWNDNIVGNDDFTINCWFRVDATTQDMCLVGSWGAESNLIFWVDIGGSSVSLTAIGTSTGFGITSTTTPIVSVNTWHMGTLVADDTAGTVTIYLDVISGSSVSYSASMSSITNPFGIGSDRGNSAVRLMDGNIALVQIYNRALSAEEIKQNYNATKGRFEV